MARSLSLVHPALAGLVGLIGLLGILQLTIELGFINPLVVARPLDAIMEIPWVHREMNLIAGFGLTFGMALAASVIAILMGVPIGYLLYRSALLGRAFEPWFAAAFAAPLVLLYPLFLAIFGRTYETLIIMGCIPASIPIIIQTRQGLLAVSGTLLNVGRSFNLSQRDMFWKIMLPSAVPTIFTGIRLGIMYALINVVAIEFLTDFGGMGRIVSEMYFRFEIPGTYASILFVLLVSISFYVIFARIERWLRPQQ
jgi:NitT/TauT family transport system permease protein